ncbi:zinc-ribbon domain-containing protein [Caproiciproducens sp. MSJ-32]|uniref:zinc-ribbon domain-containing protein n=1 Tax=Caproiciproducens sp. MSJ-32 TaxID=2841527 RepID=UPI001C10717F|nr:zinc-ribbon domain-containing protein [Caproiciproducens sp. MSJ-32]MBU5454826.1 zinc-ribbon domain-containing protein [Caproiciproducens sp. MSJ-32]
MYFLRAIYGIDLLTLVLFCISSLFNVFDNYFLSLIGSLFFIYGLLRTFSRNKYNRKRELNKFIYYLNKPLSKINLTIPSNLPAFDYDTLDYYIKILKNKFYQWKHFKIVKCPNCSQKLRLPRKKGNIIVTCKRCSHKFDLRT